MLEGLVDLVLLVLLGPGTPSWSSAEIGQGGLSLMVLWLCLCNCGGKKMEESTSAHEQRELPAKQFWKVGVREETPLQGEILSVGRGEGRRG